MQHEMVMNVLGDPLAQELLHSPLVARLGYIGRDGSPRVVPVGYVWNGTSFIVCTAVAAPKVRALAESPQVAYATIDTDSFPPHILLVRGGGAGQIVDGVPDRVSSKHVPRKECRQINGPTFEDQVHGLYPQMARITIQPRMRHSSRSSAVRIVAQTDRGRKRSTPPTDPGCDPGGHGRRHGTLSCQVTPKRSPTQPNRVLNP